MSYLLILSGLAFLGGLAARPIQGGQVLKGMENYRVVVTLLYTLPLLPLIVLTLFELGVTSWYGMTIPYIDLAHPLLPPSFLSVIFCGILLRAHYGPNHGDQMDMGTSGGTLEGDFKGMVLRFLIPIILVGVLTSGFIFPTSSPYVLGTLGLWILAGFIPALIYRWAWSIGNIDVVNVFFLKPFRSYLPDHLGPTEVAETLYAGLYQGLIALGFVLLTLT